MMHLLNIVFEFWLTYLMYLLNYYFRERKACWTLRGWKENDEDGNEYMVAEEIPNNIISAILLMYIVSSASIRSGLPGPLNSRHKLRINDIHTSVVAIIIAVLSIQISP